MFCRERESGLRPLGLSVSLIKDRRLMERECVARLACRPPPLPTTTHYPGGLEGGSRSGCAGGGVVGGKKAKMRVGGRCSCGNASSPYSNSDK